MSREDEPSRPGDRSWRSRRDRSGSTATEHRGWTMTDVSWLGPPIDVRRLFGEQHAAVVDLLGRLEPDEWATPTVCPGWCVKDVAATRPSGPRRTRPFPPSSTASTTCDRRPPLQPTPAGRPARGHRRSDRRVLAGRGPGRPRGPGDVGRARTGSDLDGCRSRFQRVLDPPPADLRRPRTNRPPRPRIPRRGLRPAGGSDRTGRRAMELHPQPGPVGAATPVAPSTCRPTPPRPGHRMATLHPWGHARDHSGACARRRRSAPRLGGPPDRFDHLDAAGRRGIHVLTPAAPAAARDGGFGRRVNPSRLAECLNRDGSPPARSGRGAATC